MHPVSRPESFSQLPGAFPSRWVLRDPRAQAHSRCEQAPGCRVSQEWGTRDNPRVPCTPPRSSPSGHRPVSRPGISNAEARQPGKAPNFSVNWTVGDSALEVINATTGKDELGRASRLCKHALYCRWMRVHGKVPGIQRGPLLVPPPSPRNPARVTFSQRP